MKSKYTSPDNAQMLTIVAAEGKKGWNVKASVKTGSGKGAPKAVTGARGQFKTEAEAKSTFAKLCKEAESHGWVKKEITSKNAFTSIPAPTAPAQKRLKSA